MRSIMVKQRLQEIALISSISIKRVRYPFLLIPILMTVIIFSIIAVRMPMESYDFYYGNCKSLLEVQALSLLKVAVAVAVIRLVFTKFALFSFWLLCLNTVLLMREIHWDFMSEGVYVGFMILLVIAWLKYDLLKEYLQSQFFLTIFSMILLCYFISVTLDGQWWTQTDRMDIVGQLTEEIIEDFGHFLVIIMTLFSRKQSRSQNEKALPR